MGKFSIQIQLDARRETYTQGKRMLAERDIVKGLENLQIEIFDLETNKQTKRTIKHNQAKKIRKL